MILYNTTAHPTPESESLISFAFRSLSASDLDIAIWLRPSFSYTYSGRTYDGVPSMAGFVHARAMRFLIVIELLHAGRSDRYPIPIMRSAPANESNGSPICGRAADWRELLSWVIGHEIYHLDRFRQRKHHWEPEADRWGKKALRLYRESAIDTEALSGTQSLP